MRILWINTKADFTGGCESYIYHTARLLSKMGCENYLLYEVEGWTEPAFTKVFDGAFPNVVLKRQISEIDPDIIYVHRLEGIKEIKELLDSGKPVIRFFHDHKLFCLREHKYKTLSLQTCTKPSGLRCYPCLGFVNRSRGKAKIRFASLPRLQAEQKANKKIQGFVVASEYMKKHLIDHKFSARKIKVLPLYSWNEFQDKSGHDANYLLFAGQLVRGKGIDILLHALKLMKCNVPLIIAGSGRQKDMYEYMAQKLGIQDQVKFTGFVNQVKLMELYKNCTCLVMPSRVPETFGLSGLEAMSFQKPVVATNVGGISEWLHDNENGRLVKSNDAHSLAKALDSLLADREKAKNMGEKGYQIYQNSFLPRHHIEPLLAYFNEIIREESHDR